MGLVYLPTWMVDFCGKLVGKYTIPMDPFSVWGQIFHTDMEHLGVKKFGPCAIFSTETVKRSHHGA